MIIHIGAYLGKGEATGGFRDEIFREQAELLCYSIQLKFDSLLQILTFL